MGVCQYLKDGGCQLVAEQTGLTLSVATVTPHACAECQKTSTPETGEINSVIASLSITHISQHQPEREQEIRLLMGDHVRLKRGDDPTLPTGPCPHFFYGACKIAGELSVQKYVSVTRKICEQCSSSNRPGPRQRNTVTASAAVRHLRAHHPDKLKQKLPELATLLGCQRKRSPDVTTLEPPATNRKLRLQCALSPGDIMTLTAAVRSLHAAHPDRWEVAVQTSTPEIWDHNSDVVQFAHDESGVFDLKVDYPSIHDSDRVHTPFLAGYTQFLETVLGVSIPLAVNRPQLYLSDEERGWMPQVSEAVGGRPVKYWIVNAGVKSCYPAKQWPVEYYQEVIDRTRHKVEWVQIGQTSHDHPTLQHVIDLRGKTSTRELIRLVYHAGGGVGPVTFLQHLCAAFEKPYVCLLGGRESVTWVSYPKQHTLHTIGALECCRDKACWVSRIVPLGDGDKKDNSLCHFPVTSGRQPVARCMQMIRPNEVISLLERYLP